MMYVTLRYLQNYEYKGFYVTKQSWIIHPSYHVCEISNNTKKYLDQFRFLLLKMIFNTIFYI